jgi:hypothetical protein
VGPEAQFLMSSTDTIKDRTAGTPILMSEKLPQISSLVRDTGDASQFIPKKL